jgi:hypothetical protein
MKTFLRFAASSGPLLSGSRAGANNESIDDAKSPDKTSRSHLGPISRLFLEAGMTRAALWELRLDPGPLKLTDSSSITSIR